jgi:protein-arginine kinase
MIYCLFLGKNTEDKEFISKSQTNDNRDIAQKVKTQFDKILIPNRPPLETE